MHIHSFPRCIAVLTVMVVLLLPMRVLGWTYDFADTDDTVKEQQLSDDGSALLTLADVTGKPQGLVQYFSTSSSTPAWTFEPDEMAFTVALSGDSATAVVSGSKVWLLNGATGSKLWNTEKGSVADEIAITPKGDWIAAGNRASDVILYRRASAMPMQTWDLGSEDGVSAIAISDNGKSIIAATKKAVYFIDVAKNKYVWRTLARRTDAVRITPDGKYAVVSAGSSLLFFNTSNAKPVWKKSLSNKYGLSPTITDDGKTLAVRTEKMAYAFDKDGKELWKFDFRTSLKGAAAVSANGRYTSVSQGKEYVYVFDNAYTEKMKPFRVYESTMPRTLAVDADGSTLSYGFAEVTAVNPAPGVLVKQKSLPVYFEGLPVKLHVFGTNPGTKNDNLKVKVALSLPQFNWWTNTTALKGLKDQPPYARSKMVQYSSEALPGYRELDDRTIAIDANGSTAVNLDLTMPDLLFPQWISDVLAKLKRLSPFSAFLKEVLPPFKDLVESDEYKTIKKETDKSKKIQSLFPLLGLGTVYVYDGETGTIYDQDSFFFIYIAEASG